MRLVLAGVVLIIAVFTAYAGVRHNGFVDFDDPLYVTDCRYVQQGMTAAGVRWAFTNYDAANWHPLTWLSHMLDVELFGLDAGMHHTVNVALHAVNAILVLACFMALTGAFWPSAAAALVWAVHPLRVESVAWVAERKDLLSAMFGLLCIIAHVWYARRPSIGRGLVAWLMLALGLMCKPMIVTWPFLLLVLDVWPLRRLARVRHSALPEPVLPATTNHHPPRSIRSLIIEKLPMIALCAASAILAMHAQRIGGSMSLASQLPYGSRLANALVSYANYVGDLFRPTNLAVLYPHPIHLPLWQLIAAPAVLSAITAVTVLLRRRMPWNLTGWLWFLGTLVPVIGLVQVGVQSMADRYTYLPHLGLLLGLALTVSWITEGRPLAMTIIAVVVSIPLWSMTRVQVQVWRDSTTLFEHALAVTTDNWTMHNNVAAMAIRRGQYAEADAHLRESIRLRPDNIQALANMSQLQRALGNDAATIRYLEQANRLNPYDMGIANNLAWMLATTRDPVMRDPTRAIDLAEQVVQGTPTSATLYPAYLEALAVAYAADGRFDDAVKTAQRALEFVDPQADAALALQIQQFLAAWSDRLQRP